MVIRKSGRKRSESSLASLTNRQRNFLVGKLDGKSDRQAALDAGYAASVANNTKQKIMSRPEVRQAFQELLDESLPPEKLVRRIREGLDATQTKLVVRSGRRTEAHVIPDYRVRFLYVVLTLKLKGLDIPPAETHEPMEVKISWIGQPPDWPEESEPSNAKIDDAH